MDLTQFVNGEPRLEKFLRDLAGSMFYYDKDDEEGRYHTNYLCKAVPPEILKGNVKGWVRTKKRPSTKEKVECVDCHKLDRKLKMLREDGTSSHLGIDF